MPIYMYLILATAFFPLVLSFDNRVRFVRHWRHFLPAMAIVAGLFLAWDYYFTEIGIWGFNPQYLLGLYLTNLPLEEVLFFVVVPFALVFIYECLRYYVPKDYLRPLTPILSVAAIAILVLIPTFNPHALYTSVTFLLSAFFILLAQFVFKVTWMGWFYLAYLVGLIPFLLVNGVLTSLPIVWYNDAHNLGLRIFSIPVEDGIYCLLLLLMNLMVYEWSKRFKIEN